MVNNIPNSHTSKGENSEQGTYGLNMLQKPLGTKQRVGKPLEGYPDQNERMRQPQGKSSSFSSYFFFIILVLRP